MMNATGKKVPMEAGKDIKKKPMSNKHLSIKQRRKFKVLYTALKGKCMREGGRQATQQEIESIYKQVKKK